MLIAEALSELRRLFPDAHHHEARLGAAFPADPGWRCQVACWTHRDETGEPMTHYGRGETFEGALADLERRDREPNRVRAPRPVDPIVAELEGIFRRVGGA